MASDLNWLYRGTTEIFPNQPESDNPDENIEQRLLRSESPLQVKLGIDPTRTDIHLGHSIPVRKLRAFQDVFSSTKMTGMGLLSNTVCEIEPIKTLSKG